jgi:lactaldehyde dehydrogenase/glycolaldehyde dehydrogenase
MFIDGEFAANSSRAIVPAINPATEDVISEISSGTDADVEAAVQSDEKAQKSWYKLPAIIRATSVR